MAWLLISLRPGWDPTQLLTYCLSDNSGETTHADVQLTASIGPWLRLDSLEDGGLEGLLQELYHTADHEHSLPVHPLHHL